MHELSLLRRLPGAVTADRTSPPPPRATPYSRMWLYTALPGTLLLVIIFGIYEVLERAYLADAPVELLHRLHIARGMGAAALLGTWGFVLAIRMRRKYAAELSRHITHLEQEVLERTNELERSRAFTEHLFESIRDHIVVTDWRGHVVKVNHVARRSVPGRCAAPCGSPTECGELCRLVDDRTGTLRRDPVTNRIFEVERYPVPSHGSEHGLVLEVARDVTDRKRLEALVVHQEKMASLGVLAAGIAHDIGNPLASLSSELEMLELEAEPQRVSESIAILREHVDRIGRALREMVDFARRRGDDEPVDVSVANAVGDALRLVRHDRRMRDIDISIDVPPDLPPVRVVEDHLVMVLVNLALNALDAMPSRGTLTVTAAREGAEHVQIRVSDTGVGMTADVAARAFEPLFTTKGERGGTGLGLTVSQSVIRGAGGTMEIRSEVGRGSEIIVTLPAGDGNG